MTGKAKAIRCHKYGPPEVLEFEDVILPALKGDEVRIRTIAAAVNHTDLEIRAGNWPIRKDQPFPYVPGVEVVGTVTEVGKDVTNIATGDDVITMMQGLGGVRADRDGGYAEYVTVEADVVAKVPNLVELYELAALGLSGVTAFEGLRRIGALKGKSILVTGAAGGVGSAAVSIAKSMGAEVSALVSRTEHIGYVIELGASQVYVSSSNANEFPSPDSFDGILDTVAGAQFGRFIDSLRPRGVLSLVGAVAGSLVNFDTWNLIKPINITGYSSEDLDGPLLRHAIGFISDAIFSGAIRTPKYELVTLGNAKTAHALLETRGFAGRLLLVP